MTLDPQTPPTRNLLPHEQRVVVELQELQARMAKLKQFLTEQGQKEPNSRIPFADIQLLVLQHTVMQSLEQVLALRIARFTDK